MVGVVIIRSARLPTLRVGFRAESPIMGCRGRVPRNAGWFTSSYSIANGTNVQVRFVASDVQRRLQGCGHGPVITVSGTEWDAFVATSLGSLVTPGAELTSRPLVGGGRAVIGPGGALRFTAPEWAAFLAGAADGEFRRPHAVASPRPRPALRDRPLIM